MIAPMNSTNSTIEALVLDLHEIGAVQFGRFPLASGRVSPIYIDLRLMISHPAVLRAAAVAYSHVLATLSFDIMAAIPYAGLPIGTAIAIETDHPLIFPRKVTKSYGTGKSIEGKWQVGQQVVIIEDLITSGGSILKGIAALKANGLVVQDAVVLIDRQQGGVANLQAEGYRLHSVMQITQLLDILETHGRINASQHQEVRQMVRASQA